MGTHLCSWNIKSKALIKDRTERAFLDMGLLLGYALAIVEQVDLDVGISKAGDIHARQIAGLQQDDGQASGGRLPAERDEQLATSLGAYLQATWLYFLADGERFLGYVADLDGGQWADYLADDIVARVPIEAEYDKVQAHVLQIVHVQAVECEVLVVNRIPGVAHHASLNLVLLVRQQLQLHIRIGGCLGASIHASGYIASAASTTLAGQPAAAYDGDHESVPFSQVAQLEVNGAKLSVLISDGQLLAIGQCLVQGDGHIAIGNGLHRRVVLIVVLGIVDHIQLVGVMLLLGQLRLLRHLVLLGVLHVLRCYRRRRLILHGREQAHLLAPSGRWRLLQIVRRLATRRTNCGRTARRLERERRIVLVLLLVPYAHLPGTDASHSREHCGCGEAQYGGHNCGRGGGRRAIG